ncbi:MAG: HEAT repeat domain-containing protein, partial [Planctomycetes bacterium]|nr:HEAT repeat domain-containing protein [Planctomycetota bacterium]
DDAALQRAVAALGSRYFDERESARAELLQAAAAARPHLRAALAHPDARVRGAAAEILAAGGDTADLPRLVELLADEDPEVRDLAIRSVIRYGPDARPVLEAARTRRPELAPILDQILPELLASVLERELDALITSKNGFGFYDGQFRRIAALGRDATPILLRIFLDPTYAFATALSEERRTTVRWLAGESLAEVGDAGAVPPLRRLLEDREAFLQTEFTDAESLEDTVAFVLARLGEPEHLTRLRLRLEEEAAPQADSLNARLGVLCLRMDDPARAEVIFRGIAARLPEHGAVALTMACILSRQNRRAEGMEWLRKAVEAGGYDDAEWVARDGDLANLREEPEFAEILRGLGGRRRPGKPR